MSDYTPIDSEFDFEKMLLLSALSGEDLDAAVKEEPSWETLYHFSRLRTNIFATTVFTGEERILEIGAQCGALTGYLCDHGAWVDAVEDNQDYIMVLSPRMMDRDNLRILQGTIDEVWEELSDHYDMIVMAGADPALIGRLAGKIGIGGRILLAAQNRFGLKYFAGCREDESGQMFTGIEGVPGAPAYGLGQIEDIVKKAGLSIAYRYFPYPDWKLCDVIYSQERLPFAGELWENERNFDRPRASLFDEQRAFDGIIANGFFPIFANSFLLEISHEKDKAFRDEHGRLIPSSKIYKTNAPTDRILYSKASNDRAKPFRIFTDLVRQTDDKKNKFLFYRKRAEEGAGKHLTDISVVYEQMERATFGGNVRFNRCSVRRDGLYFEPVEGESLDKTAWAAIDDEERLAEIFTSVKSTLEKIHKHLGFIVTEGFSRVFGDIPTYGGGEDPVELGISAKYLDCDILLSNILVEDGMWNVIDYEWSFPFPVPINFAVYRCIKNFYIYHGIFDESVHEKMMLKVGLTKEQLPIFAFMDENMIKNYVLKDYTNLSDLGQRLLKVSVGLKEIIDAQGKLARKEEMIQELTKTLADTQKAVHDLQNCASMKITAPLRAIASVFRKEEPRDKARSGKNFQDPAQDDQVPARDTAQAPVKTGKEAQN